MKKFLAFAVAFAAITLSGCIKDTVVSTDNCAIRVTSTIDGHTLTRATVSAFGNDHHIGIYKTPAGATDFTGAHRLNAKYSHAGNGDFAPATTSDKLFWKPGAVDFVAYFPYGTVNADHTIAIDVATDIDFLYSDKLSGKVQGDAVNFLFHHQLSKLKFVVTDEDTAASLAGMTTVVKNVNTKATFNLEAGTLGSAGTVGDVPGTWDNAGATANIAETHAIVLPGTYTGLKVLFTLANGDFGIADLGDKTFASDKQYTFNITLKPGVEPQVEILVTGSSIHDWDDGGVTPVDVTKEPGQTTAEPAINETSYISDFDGVTEIPAAAGAFQIYFTLDNPVDGQSVVAGAGTSSWITVAETTSGGARRTRAAATKDVYLDVAVEANTGEARPSTIVLEYNGKALKTIEFTQVAGATGVEIGAAYTLQPASSLKWAAWDTALVHNGVSWTPTKTTVVGSPTVGNWDGNGRGQQFGAASSNQIDVLTMTGTGYSGGIKSVNVSSCCKSGNAITMGVSVGGTAMTSINATQTVSGSDANAVVTANFTSETALSGDIVITYDLETPGALYVNTIKVN